MSATVTTQVGHLATGSLNPGRPTGLHVQFYGHDRGSHHETTVKESDPGKTTLTVEAGKRYKIAAEVKDHKGNWEPVLYDVKDAD